MTKLERLQDRITNQGIGIAYGAYSATRKAAVIDWGREQLIVVDKLALVSPYEETDSLYAVKGIYFN